MNNKNLQMKSPSRLKHSLVAVGVSFALLFTGSMVMPASSAHAYSASKAQNIVSTAKRYLGTPYKFGAPMGTTRVFDCSSFTKTMFQKYGVSLPRTSKEQSHSGYYVSKSNLKPGDLVFFYKPIHHVGIYIGNGKMIHTWGKPGVTISNINTGWWKDHYTTARRVL